MRREFHGGPLDGAILETTPHSIEPELVHFSESRRVHHYSIGVKGHMDNYDYISRDTIINEEAALYCLPPASLPSMAFPSKRFEAWWEKQSDLKGSEKDVAWHGWCAAIQYNLNLPNGPEVDDEL